MSRSIRCVILILMLVITAVTGFGCERTIDEEVIGPLEAAYAQKEVASLEAAVANVRTVRSALMRYPATSSDNLYPGGVLITDYDSLREVLADDDLPAKMDELMWDPSFGIRYVSDGYTFTFKVRVLGGEEVITAAPEGTRVVKQ